ncbi:carboxypeptidase-like regulatory domain-containing protein [Methanolacinia paynteri]|uniref:carboxypeptidase-like regulatory domain-containing protein n=1 Tax=Methanolacinia paynteri TaxID=230356 RepID=UPI000A01A9EE|nr:carboxypeptidase-like regulatory domain-containing protein [Methanolacinia paynteri]
MKLKLLLVIFLVLLLLFANHPVSALSSPGDDNPISIVITSPANGSRFHSDVVPHQVRVLANISSTYNITGVTLDSGWETIEAEEPFTEIDEEIRIDSSGNRSIVVTARDEKGNLVSGTTEFTIIIGPPVSQRYAMQFTVRGQITDSNGKPVNDCRVRINSSFYKYLGEYMGSTNVTDINGSYLIKNVYGPDLMITAEKEGYLKYESVESFESDNVEFDIVMMPEKKELPLPGFIIILSTGLAVFLRKRNRMKRN